MNRYHLTLGHKRTPGSLDTLLADLLAIRLGACPQACEAHGAVRAWLQHPLDPANDPGRIRVSPWLRDQSVLFLVDEPLSENLLGWVTGESLIRARRESLETQRPGRRPDSVWTVRGFRPRGRTCGQRMNSHTLRPSPPGHRSLAIHTLPTLIHRLTTLRRVGGQGLMRVNQQQQTLDRDELNGMVRERPIQIYPSTAGHDK